MYIECFASAFCANKHLVKRKFNFPTVDIVEQQQRFIECEGKKIKARLNKQYPRFTNRIENVHVNVSRKMFSACIKYDFCVVLLLA